MRNALIIIFINIYVPKNILSPKIHELRIYVIFAKIIEIIMYNIHRNPTRSNTNIISSKDALKIAVATPTFQAVINCPIKSLYKVSLGSCLKTGQHSIFVI